jgi:hypothetical protein
VAGSPTGLGARAELDGGDAGAERPLAFRVDEEATDAHLRHQPARDGALAGPVHADQRDAVAVVNRRAHGVMIRFGVFAVRRR